MDNNYDFTINQIRQKLSEMDSGATATAIKDIEMLFAELDKVGISDDFMSNAQVPYSSMPLLCSEKWKS